jgi:hypothetical protein
LIDFAAECCQFLIMTATMILKEIQALPADEKDWLFKKLENAARKTGNGQIQKRRSVLRLAPLPGQWIGERVLRSGDLADEMFAAE